MRNDCRIAVTTPSLPRPTQPFVAFGDPELFDVAQRQGRAVATYNRPDFEAIVRQYAEANREHHGLVIVHPLRFPSWEFARLTAALSALLEGPDRGRSFLVWLQASVS